MFSKKYTFPIFASLLLIPFAFSCPSTNSHDILRNQTGTLSWKGSPAVDGAGMLFIVEDTEYGAPGTPEDYSELFGDNEYEVEIRADIKLTGEETVRGWGATFPAIVFINIEKI